MESALATADLPETWKYDVLLVDEQWALSPPPSPSRHPAARASAARPALQHQAASGPLRLQSEAADREVANVEDKLRLQVQTARLVADAAARIKFENIGVITDVTSTQPGRSCAKDCRCKRYGVIRGTLQYISPETKPSLQTKQPVYEGRVTLEQDQYKVGDTAYPLRYGMTAVAEIVVRERRLIDLVKTD